MCTIRFSANDDKRVFLHAKTQVAKLRNIICENNEQDVLVLGPARDTMIKMNKKYRWNITIKANSREKILQILKRWINVKKRGGNITVNIKFE